MSLSQVFKDRMFAAMKSKDEVEKDCFRTILGEVQLQEQKSGVALPDDKIQQILKTSITNSNIVLAEFAKNLGEFGGKLDKVKREIQLLSEFLPKNGDLSSIPSEVLDQVKSVSNDGQAVGIVMKYFKGKNESVDGVEVKKLVLQIRGT